MNHVHSLDRKNALKNQSEVALTMKERQKKT